MREGLSELPPSQSVCTQTVSFAATAATSRSRSSGHACPPEWTWCHSAPVRSAHARSAQPSRSQ